MLCSPSRSNGPTQAGHLSREKTAVAIHERGTIDSVTAGPGHEGSRWLGQPTLRVRFQAPARSELASEDGGATGMASGLEVSANERES
jgi:hypothetical protein